MEAERGEGQPDDERPQAVVVGETGDRGGHDLAVTAGAGDRRAGGPERVAPGVTDADQQHLADTGMAEDRVTVHLAGLAGGLVVLEESEQVEPELVGEIGGAGAHGGTLGVVRRLGREHRQGHDDRLALSQGMQRPFRPGEPRGKDLCG